MKGLGTTGWGIWDLIQRYEQVDPANVGGHGTGNPNDPDDPPVPEPSGPPVRTSPPAQKFTQADLDAAASNARGAEKEKVRARHEREIEQKDARIAGLEARIADLESEVSGYEESIRLEYEQIVEHLPDYVKAFAPGEGATGKELKDFIVKSRNAVAATLGHPITPTERSLQPDPMNPQNPLPPAPAPPVPPSPPPAPIQPQGPVTVTEEIEERRRTGGRRF